jgi:hypothetical protein
MREMTKETSETALITKNYSKINLLWFVALISSGAGSVRRVEFWPLTNLLRQSEWRPCRGSTDALCFLVGPRCAPDLAESNAAFQGIRADGWGAFSC